MTKKLVAVDEVTLGEVIDMALSDHVSFSAINDLFGLSEDEVKTIMRAHLRPARYRAWRSRVQTFGDRRASYKRDDPRRASGEVRHKPREQHETDNEVHDEGHAAPPERPTQRKKRALAKP
jgi:uncharacterized protein (TIGR03643 family)